MSDARPVIEINDLRVEYNADVGKRIVAVDGLSLSVKPGEVVGFIGPNGAGKSTTIKALMGFQRPTGGTARIFDLPAGAVAARKRVGFLPEVALYYPFLTARETLRMFAKLREIPRNERESVIDHLLELVNLQGRDNEPVRRFSKGMLQRVGIAQAIMGEPDLLVLDEVTSGLDPVARYDVRNVLMNFKAKGKTVFFSSHELSEVTMLCDRVILIDNGKVIEEDSIDNLVSSVKRYILRAENFHPPSELPNGVYVQDVRNGGTTFSAENPEARDDLRKFLNSLDVQPSDEREEQGSLEDVFVRSIGHKVS